MFTYLLYFAIFMVAEMAYSHVIAMIVNMAFSKEYRFLIKIHIVLKEL